MDRASSSRPTLPSRDTLTLPPWGAPGQLDTMTETDQEIDTLRHMSAAQKLAVMHALIRQAFELKAAAVRARWPELSDEEIRERTRALVSGDDS